MQLMCLAETGLPSAVHKGCDFNDDCRAGADYSYGEKRGNAPPFFTCLVFYTRKNSRNKPNQEKCAM